MAYEIPFMTVYPSGLTIDGGFPVVNPPSENASSTKTITISTAAASLIVVMVPTASIAATSVTSTSLTFTKQTGATPFTTIWTAPSAGALSSEVISVAAGSQFCRCAAYSITGADSANLTNAIGANAQGAGPATFSFTAAASGSLLLWAELNSTTSLAAAANNVLDLTVQDGSADDFTFGRYSPNPVAGTYTLGATTSNGAGWRYAAIEIRSA